MQRVLLVLAVSLEVATFGETPLRGVDSGLCLEVVSRGAVHEFPEVFCTKRK